LDLIVLNVGVDHAQINLAKCLDDRVNLEHLGDRYILHFKRILLEFLQNFHFFGQVLEV
jgi:hypothetical protein